ncbi:DUF3752 domain-containing protein [Phanerochaete sordida]|uniref:DUF3752 domain-containing protein n=1 Tax=Phanerochaete sordida TaxID=48140 RepID=A0A9P3GRB1_9APHY|nr:DUF3752 domain-containing protein [Phanerochaete sordida]
MIGPDIPAHLLQNRSTTPDDGPEEAGPSQPPPAIGPVIPPELHSRDRTPQANNEEDEDEDDYVPELPPDLAAARAKPNAGAKRVQGPSFPGAPPRRQYDDDSDDDVGPMPLPAGYVLEEKDGVTEFLEREERRRKQLEEASKPKTLQREEWMLKPPSSSDLLSSIDPTKLTKGRQFARSAAPSRDVDNSLWTETPAERQARIADEVSGKRRRATNADPELTEEKQLEARKRARYEEEIRKGVDDHTRRARGAALLDQHSDRTAKTEKKKDGDEPPAFWDRDRDMALGGRLMDDSTRNKFINDARGLSDRFGSGKSGSFL